MANETKLPRRKVTGKEAFSARRVICGIALILAAIIIGLILIPVLSTSKTYEIIMVRQDTPAGVCITQENYKTYLEARNTTDKSLVDAGITDVSKIFGKYTARNLYGGAQLVPRDITDIAIVESNDVPEGKELVGVHIGSIETDVAYMPKSGDIIRIYGMKNDGGWHVTKYGRMAPNETEAFAYELLSYIEIYEVYDSNGTPRDYTDAVPTNFVMVGTPEQVRQVIEAQANGSLYFSLITTDHDRGQRLLASQQKVVEEYKLLHDMGEEVEKDPFSIAMGKLDRDEEYIPKAGDVVRLSYLNTFTVKQLNDRGVIETVTKTEKVTPELLEYVKVLDLYDNTGASVALSDREITNIDRYQVSLALSEEQVAEIEKIADKKIFFEVVRPEVRIDDYGFEIVDASNIEDGLTDVDIAIRRVRIDKFSEKAEQILKEQEDALKAEQEKNAEKPAETPDSDQKKPDTKTA